LSLRPLYGSWGRRESSNKMSKVDLRGKRVRNYIDMAIRTRIEEKVCHEKPRRRWRQARGKKPLSEGASYSPGEVIMVSIFWRAQAWVKEKFYGAVERAGRIAAAGWEHSEHPSEEKLSLKKRREGKKGLLAGV